MKPVTWVSNGRIGTHTLVFSDETKIDMTYVCPRDVKNMLVLWARSVYWKKWAAKHEQEELKVGAWIEPALALLRKKAKGAWTEKHRNVARKIFLEGGWTQKRLIDIDRSDVSQCQACQMEEGTEKHRLYHCPEWHAVRRDIPESFTQWEQKARTSKKEWRESEKHRSWRMPVEGFKGRVATDGSLSGKTGKWGAPGWAVVQLDYEEEMEPLHAMYGSVEADLEVQRTIKRAELTALLMFFFVEG